MLVIVAYLFLYILQVVSRMENEHYLRKHPELSVLISNFVRCVLNLVMYMHNILHRPYK